MPSNLYERKGITIILYQYSSIFLKIKKLNSFFNHCTTHEYALGGSAAYLHYYEDQILDFPRVKLIHSKPTMEHVFKLLFLNWLHIYTYTHIQSQTFSKRLITFREEKDEKSLIFLSSCSNREHRHWAELPFRMFYTVLASEQDRTQTRL